MTEVRVVEVRCRGCKRVMENAFFDDATGRSFFCRGCGNVVDIEFAPPRAPAPAGELFGAG